MVIVDNRSQCHSHPVLVIIGNLEYRGEANFIMLSTTSTRLTIGGCTQAGVAGGLIDMAF